jgi:hypothetical protein
MERIKVKPRWVGNYGVTRGEPSVFPVRDSLRETIFLRIRNPIYANGIVHTIRMGIVHGFMRFVR